MIGEPDLSSCDVTALEPVRLTQFDLDRAKPSARESLEKLYVELAPELVRFATTLVGPSQAEDLLGSTFVNVAASNGWDRVSNKRAYLYRVMVNEAHKSRRATRRRLAREIRVVHRDGMDIEQALDPDVLAALQRLSVRQRAVIHLIYWADLAPQQVAETIGTSLRTVERELKNARTRLKAILS